MPTEEHKNKTDAQWSFPSIFPVSSNLQQNDFLNEKWCLCLIVLHGFFCLFGGWWNMLGEKGLQGELDSSPTLPLELCSMGKGGNVSLHFGCHHKGNRLLQPCIALRKVIVKMQLEFSCFFFLSSWALEELLLLEAVLSRWYESKPQWIPTILWNNSI